MEQPPYSALPRRHGSPHAVGDYRGFAAEGRPPSSVTMGGRTNAPPPRAARPFFAPVGFRNSAPRRPSPPMAARPFFAPVGGRHYPQPYYAADGGPGGYGQGFAAAQGPACFLPVDGRRVYAQPPSPFTAEGGPGGYGQNFAAAAPGEYLAGEYFATAAPGEYLATAAPGEYLAAPFDAGQGQPLFRPPGLAAGQGQPLFRPPGLGAGHGQSIFHTPGLGAGQGQSIFHTPGLAYNHGVAMDPEGRASHAPDIGTVSPIPALTLAPSVDSSTMASTTARMSRVPVLSDVRVQTITRENSHAIFGRMKQALLQRRGRRVFISIDLEYAASSETDVSSQQRCSMQWYESLKNFVDGGDTVQLGLVFAFDSECPEPVQAYEVNIQFDETSRSYSDKSISFLIDNGHVLEDYRNQGVLPEWLYADLLRHFPFYDDSVTWVTFHADRDIGFLMKLSVYGGRGLLPNNKLIFMHDASRCFPVLFDVRVLAQVLIPGFRGSLKNLANHLGIQRTGKEHFAGSDALLTIGCFLKVVEQSADEGLVARIGLLSGAEELEMSIQCALSVSHSAIYMKDVMWEKYPEEGARIHETMRSNFNVIGVQVLLSASSSVDGQSLGDTASVQDRYQRMLTMLNSVDTFEVQLCFLNAEAKVAYGRVLKFRIDGADQAQALARILASSGATHNPETIWVTMHGEQGIACLLRSFAAPTQLPGSYKEYLSCRRCCFPSLIDLAVVANGLSEIPVLATGCKGDLAHISSSLGIASHRLDIVTMLRCYACFRDRGHLRNLMPGRLTENCCSSCKN